MIWAIFGLSAGFVLVLGFLYYLLIRTQLGLVLKLVAVVVVSVFYWIQYQSLQQYTGWPSHDDLPDEFVLISADVVEPDKQTGEEGVMYWWVRDADNLELPPRVFQLPYRAPLHEQSQDVVEEQQKGSVYVGRQDQSGSAGDSLGVSFEKISKASRMKKN
jgi:hypothetical protein